MYNVLCLIVINFEILFVILLMIRNLIRNSLLGYKNYGKKML
jgi:hypothetical protein